jgi:hypothetical protein
MVSVGEEDFLVTTGTTLKDPAIGMFVNLEGDPVRGTLMFSTYPRAISKSYGLAMLMVAINYPHVFAMMQDFNVEIHSVESQQVVQIITSPFISGNATITRVPDGSMFCLEPVAQKLIMLPFDPKKATSSKRTDEEVQVARRLAMRSSLPTPWFLQADTLLDANRVEEALALSDKASQAMDDMHFDAERLVYMFLTLHLIHSSMKWRI